MTSPTRTGPVRTGPVRTCIGCRQRAPREALLRLVWDPVAGRVVLDPTRTMPGRGASLHPNGACWEQAVRRRAVGRALRVPAVDATQVRGLREQWLSAGGAGPVCPDGPAGSAR